MIPLLQTKTADTANTEIFVSVIRPFVVVVVVVVVVIVFVVVVLGGAGERGHPSLFCCSELQYTIVISHMFPGLQGRWEGLGTIKLG